MDETEIRLAQLERRSDEHAREIFGSGDVLGMRTKLDMLLENARTRATQNNIILGAVVGLVLKALFDLLNKH